MWPLSGTSSRCEGSRVLRGASAATGHGVQGERSRAWRVTCCGLSSPPLAGAGPSNGSLQAAVGASARFLHSRGAAGTRVCGRVRARGAQRLQGHEGRRALGRAPAPGAPRHLTFAHRHRQQLGDASKPRVPALRRDSVWGRGLPPRPRWSRLRINERGQPGAGARGPPPLPHVLVSWWPFPSTAELQGSRFAWSFLSLPTVSKSRSASV